MTDSILGCAQRRIKTLRERMDQLGIESFYVRDTSNIAWLSAFENVFDEEPAHAAFVDSDSCMIHTDSRYLTAFVVASQDGPWEVRGASSSHAKWLRDLLKPEYSLGIEDSISLAEFRGIEKELCRGDFKDEESILSGRIIETSHEIVNLRGIKDAYEIGCLRHAQSITDAAFSHIVGFVKPGMTEREVQIELEDYMLRHGASSLAFASIVASGSNGASPHAIPGETKLEAGQCVVMDFGARAKGYCSDMTRMVFLGEPSQKMRQAYEILREANEDVEAMLRPGVTGSQAHHQAELILTKGGFGGKMGHALGHGVGIDIHEEPVLAPRNTLPLVPGNVVTVEPGIYIEGEFGMRLEDFGVITDNGFDVFSKSTHEMVII